MKSRTDKILIKAIAEYNNLSMSCETTRIKASSQTQFSCATSHVDGGGVGNAHEHNYVIYLINKRTSIQPHQVKKEKN